MERNWYYAVDGVRQGPVTLEEIGALVESGALRSEDLLWQPEFGGEWRTVAQARAFFARPADGEPAAEVAGLRGRGEFSLAVPGARPSCLEAAALAYARVVEVLFKPFDLTRWFSMGFCAWLAYIGTQSGGFNGMGDSRGGLFKNQPDGFLDKLTNLWAHPGLLAFLVALVVLSLLLALWMCLLRSRGDFMFLHRWYRPDAAILQCWSASRAAGQALFMWRVRFFLVSAALFAVDLAFAYALVLRPYLAAGKAWSGELVRPTVGCATAAVLLLVGVQLVAHLAKAFVVPVMYWHDVTVEKAWQVVFALGNRYPLALLGYLLSVMLCWILATLALVLFVLCTCCVGGIPLMLPYFNAVVMLPALLFFRGYPVCFLSLWRAEVVPAKA